MKKYTSLISVFFILLCLLPPSTQAWEYFISPPNFSPEVPLKWYEFDNDAATGRITILIDDSGISDITGGDPDNGVTATINALHEWNAPTLDRLVTAVATTAPSFNVIDGQPTLHFTDPTGDCIYPCLALTFITHYDMSDVNSGAAEIRSCNGRDYLPYYDADIVTNNTAWNWTSLAEVTGGDSCSSEFYIEAVIGHEAGHMLGLSHEDDVMLISDALMYPALDYCDNKTLQLDDLTGRDVIYDCPDNCSNPSLPTAAFSSIATELSVSFTDQSTDSDGNIMAWLWDFGDGGSSTLQNPTHAYASNDTYTVSLTVTDNDGLTGNTQQEITVSVDSGISLSATGYKQKGVQWVDLSWSGGASNVDILRDGAKVAPNLSNTGAYSYNSGIKGGGNTNAYTVCDANTSNCSNTVNVAF